jgi:DNA polymerase III subunit delta'
MAAATAVSEVFGHADVRRALTSAVRRDDLPGSLLIHGPTGVGRQTLARWLARLLVCQQQGDSAPCGRCTGCRLALDLQHPDIHWFFPLPRPKGAASPEKLADALETARHEALADRRSNPLYQPPADEPIGLYLAQVRTIRRLSSSRPAMASRQVFIIGDAELLVPQEASEEAANAMLKILEEPPPDTTLILTAADPEALLPTLRSRLLPVRLAPMGERAIAEFLEERAGADPDRARVLARLGRGSIGRALAFLDSDGSPGRAEATRQRALAWVSAAIDPAPAARYAAAMEQKPTGARGGFGETLDAMSLCLRDLAAVAIGAEADVVDTGALDQLRAMAPRVRADRLPDAIRLVEEARDGGRINANPQLTLASLLNRLASSIVA